MKKVINASVGGRNFAFNEDAYDRLASYFDHFQARLASDPSGNEVMSDLEVRIAELFNEGTSGIPNRVVDLALVTRTVEQLGMPDGTKEPMGEKSSFAGSPSPESSTKESATGPDLSYSGAKGEAARRLFRDPDNKAIGGVCSGLAAFLNIDITIVRIVLLVAFLVWGSGLLAYLVLWIVVPLAKTPADKCVMRGLEPNAENMSKFSSQRRDGYGK